MTSEFVWGQREVGQNLLTALNFEQSRAFARHMDVIRADYPDYTSNSLAVAVSQAQFDAELAVIDRLFQGALEIAYAPVVHAAHAEVA